MLFHIIGPTTHPLLLTDGTLRSPTFRFIALNNIDYISRCNNSSFTEIGPLIRNFQGLKIWRWAPRLIFFITYDPNFSYRC